MTNLSAFRQSEGLCGLARQGQIMLMQFHMQRLLSTQHSKLFEHAWTFSHFSRHKIYVFIIANQQYGPQVVRNTLQWGLT